MNNPCTDKLSKTPTAKSASVTHSRVPANPSARMAVFRREDPEKIQDTNLPLITESNTHEYNPDRYPMNDTDIDSGSEKQDLIKTTAEVTEVSRNESISPMNDTDKYPMNDTDINDDSDTENLAREIAENSGEEDDRSPRRVSINFASEIKGRKFWISVPLSGRVDKKLSRFEEDKSTRIIPRGSSTRSVWPQRRRGYELTVQRLQRR